MTFRRAFLAVFSTALLLGLAWGCSAADNSGNLNPSGGGSNGIAEVGNDPQVWMPEAGPQDAGQLDLNPLCGKKAEERKCVPDSPLSCIDYTPPDPPSEDASAS